jgi:hypothetical protein
MSSVRSFSCLSQVSKTAKHENGIAAAVAGDVELL